MKKGRKYGQSMAMVMFGEMGVSRENVGEGKVMIKRKILGVL